MGRPIKKVKASAVKVLGAGGPACEVLRDLTLEALEILCMESEVDYVTDLTLIEAYGLTVEPTLVVDGHILAVDRVLDIDEIVELIAIERHAPY